MLIDMQFEMPYDLRCILQPYYIIILGCKLKKITFLLVIELIGRWTNNTNYFSFYFIKLNFFYFEVKNLALELIIFFYVKTL